MKLFSIVAELKDAEWITQLSNQPKKALMMN
ncbi:MAG: hypothetical protein RL708_1750 [Bacteroidota bacterium]|jgi:hypothetical protein